MHCVAGLEADDLVLVLMSGGGSALLPWPRPGLSLEAKTAAIRELSRGGATIIQLNTVRQRLSGLKGGGLARKIFPAQVGRDSPYYPYRYMRNEKNSSLGPAC